MKKNPFLPLCMSIVTTLMAVSPAQAFEINIPKISIPHWLGGGNHNGGGNNSDVGNQQEMPTPSQPVQVPDNYTPEVAASVNLNALIQSVVASSSQIGQTTLNQSKLKAIYALRGGRALWVNDSGLTQIGQTLQLILTTSAYEQGLSGAYYLTDDVMSRLQATDAQSLAELDAMLTQGYISFVSDLATGRINPKDPSQKLGDIEMPKNSGPSLASLNAITGAPRDLAEGVNSFVPSVIGYQALMNSLAMLHAGVDQGGWIALDSNRASLKLGDSNSNIIAIRQRLVDLGYMDQSYRSSQNTQYDRDLFKAVVLFQTQNFLGADGAIGPATYRAFDITIDQAINQVRANMEKWRFMPRTFPDRYLFVDMGRQELDIMESGRKNPLVDRMRVIVGKDLHGTPTMTDRVTQIIEAPYWYLPDSIIVNETIPKMLADPTYLATTKIHFLDGNGKDVDVTKVDWSKYTVKNPPPYLVRQETGPANSLGLIKFELTNAHAIYLHDTDDHTLFSQSIRYLSHGCIRLERPFDLAAYLLRDKGETADQIRKEASDPTIHAKPVAVKPITVYIFGTTTVSYPNHTVVLGQDIWGQDALIIQAMDRTAVPAAVAPVVAAPAVAN